MHHDIKKQSYISDTNRKCYRNNESYRNFYQDLPTVIGLTIPKNGLSIKKDNQQSACMEKTLER